MSRPPTEDTPDTRLAILSPFASSEDPFDSPMTIPDSTEELFESLVSTSFPPSSKPHVETSADNTSSLREPTIAKVETAAKSSIGISSFGDVKTLSRPFVVSEPIGIPSTSTADSRGAPLTQTQSLLMTEHSEADSQADISKQSKFASQPSAHTGSADLYISDPVMPLKEQGSIAAKTPESGAGLAVKPPTLDSHETPTIAKRVEAAPVDHQSPGLITDKPNDVAQMSPALFPDNQKIALQGNNEPPTRQHTPPDNALHAEFGTLSKAFTGASPLNEATEVSQTSILNTKSEAGRHGKRLNASSVVGDRPGSLRSPAAAVSLSGPAKVNTPDISNGSSMSSGKALADPDPHNLSSDGEHSSQSDTYGDADESRDELGENISDDKEGLRIEGDPSGTLTLSATARKRDVEVERDSEERMVTTIRGHTFNGEQGNIDRSGAHHEKQFSRTSLVPKPPPSDPSSTPKQVEPLTSIPTMQNRNANDQTLPTGKDPQSKPSMTDSPLKNEALGKLDGKSMAETRDPVSQPNARSLEGGRQVLQSQGNLLAAESPLMSNDSNLSKPMDTTRHQERRLAVNTSPDDKHARVSIDETPEKNITGIHGSSTLEMVDLVPLRDTLREVADLISGQIPYEDLSWGRAVLAQFGTQVRPLLVQFMEDSPKWKGFVVAAPS
ncbi:unnamed protein product [Somion occarium]|uniref:Uncharacterized protein n=1 Tax=Somion occarium TaxID=3059160 RepID=A0ABP1CMH7_9APHY